MERNVCLGIDIGGTNTAFGLVDARGKILLREYIPTRKEMGPQALFKRIFNALENKVSQAAESFHIAGIGVGAPNGNYYNGTIEYPPNLGWENVDVVKLVKQFMDLPVRITNDANAAALGEMQFGSAKNFKHFIEITLGTGLGSGIVVDGKILYGADGAAGELGHTIVVPNGRLCNCGKKGCLETYCSAEGIRRTVFELMAEMNGHSPLRSIAFTDLTAKEIARLAEQGDAIALTAFDVTARILGRALADASAIFSPQAIILFGGLSQAGDLLLRPLKEYFEQHLMKHQKGKIRILVSGLPESDAAILGAAALIWQEID